MADLIIPIYSEDSKAQSLTGPTSHRQEGYGQIANLGLTPGVMQEGGNLLS